MTLGERIDLHSGGEDNIFPHHECEIAQSCCGFGQPSFANHWFHTRHLQVEGEKMSKSKGNFFTARDLFAKGVTPAALRLELVRTHYRTNANFTMQGLRDCQRMIDRWARAQQVLDAAGATCAPDPAAAPGPMARALGAFIDAVCDDLNLARAIAALNEACGEDPSGCPHAERAALARMDSVFAVLERNASQQAPTDDPFTTQVEALIAQRLAARAAKDWAAGDAIRAQLVQLGVTIKDGADGTTWTRTV
jgi:cysteinyl-tRNA synthetase